MKNIKVITGVIATLGIFSALLLGQEYCFIPPSAAIG